MLHSMKTLLVKSDAVDGKDTIIDLLKSWEGDTSKVNEKKLNKWMKEGLVFPLSNTLPDISADDSISLGLPKRRYSAADIFVNIAGARYVHNRVYVINYNVCSLNTALATRLLFFGRVKPI